VVLHTVYPPSDPPEYTDIVFSGVVAYHIEQQTFRNSGVSANIIFDVKESEAKLILSQYADLLAASKNYGWPTLEYANLDELVMHLTSNGTKCFEIHSSCGLFGFVFAARMEFRNRRSRAFENDSALPTPPDSNAN